MTNLFDTWQHLSAPEQVFIAIGLISNVIFIFYILLSQFLDTDHDLNHFDISDEISIPLLSLRSLLAFFMFAGWTGFALIRNGLSTTLAIVGAVAAGFFAAWLAYRLLLWILSWQSSGTLNLDRAVGHTGTVYLSIPEQGEGKGKIHIELQGALREMDAISANEPLETGIDVLVLEYDPEKQVLIVEKTPKKLKDYLN